MAKSPDAFRTISEVAEWLDTQAHVLRFWESKFTQVKPVKRAGGRRYYRPQDMLLLGGIKTLLHDDGMTIKGAQKLLREKGVKFVSGLSQPLEGGDTDTRAVPTEVPATEKSLPDSPVPAGQFNEAMPAASDETLPETAALADDTNDVPELDEEGLKEIARAGTAPESDDDTDELPDPAPTGGVSDLFAHTRESGTPDGSDDEDMTPAQDTIPAFLNRVSELGADMPETARAEDGDVVPDSPADKEHTTTITEPDEAATLAGPETVAGGSSSAATPYPRETFMRQLAQTTHIAPQNRARAAQLVAELTALRAQAGESETA